MRWEEGDLHGRHVRPGADVRGAIKWDPAVGRSRVRVRDCTCECMPVVYELCMAGGLSFIRKTTRVGVNVKVEEFTTRPNSRVHDLWNSLFDLPNKLVRFDSSGPQSDAEQHPTDDKG
ncbi:hypothetical protein E1292_49960 [Nonomuraea deserti]|uniref:Uncharacterized protein n=1 Tax=Nonomuraea deserti TaxID=1848322 RepID=A0A4R4TY86_9ACTN|nr:hypothetical protein [Nonomuraea deserti]TDC83340.1 hypothetical protein E1292_49960 [Nonomuraea deserti]